MFLRFLYVSVHSCHSFTCNFFYQFFCPWSQEWFPAFGYSEQCCCDRSYNCLPVQGDAFFPIHHFDQIATKMDLFLMKLLLIKFPGIPRQCWGRRPGAGGVSAALRGRRNTLTLGLVVPLVKVAGIWAWGHSMGEPWGSRYPQISPFSLCFHLPTPAAR